MSFPFRQLTVKNAEWKWSDSQEKAWNEDRACVDLAREEACFEEEQNPSENLKWSRHSFTFNFFQKLNG